MNLDQKLQAASRRVQASVKGGHLPGSVARVNKVLQEMGIEERVAQGKGYVYFHGGDSASWEYASIFVNQINELTVQEIVDKLLHFKRSQ